MGLLADENVLDRAEHDLCRVDCDHVTYQEDSRIVGAGLIRTQGLISMSTIEPAPQLWERSSGRELRWCLTAILCMLLLQRVWHLYSTIDSAPPHVDEASHMQSAYFYKLLFLDRDTEHAAWKNFPSYDQPPVRRYILGLSLHWMRGTVVDTSGGFMDWHRRCVNGMFREPLVRTARHAEPEKAEASQSLIAYCDDLLLQLEPTEATRLDHEDFRQGRVTVFFFGVLATALLVLIGSKLSGSLFAGLLAGLVFLGNKVTVPGFQQVLSDTLWSFFTLLCLVLLFAVFHELDRHKRWPRVIMLAVLAGVCLALALGTKLIAAYMAATVVLAFGASMLLILFKSIRSKAGLPTRELLQRATALLLISGSSLLLFVLMNPFLYEDTIGNMLKMAKHRSVIMEIQSTVQFPAIHSSSERLEAVYRNGVLLGVDFKGLQGPHFWYICLLVLGVATLGHGAVNELANGRFGPHAITIIWIATAFAMIGPRVHMHWERYFLPFVICTSLVLAMGAERFVWAIELALAKRSAKREAAIPRASET